MELKHVLKGWEKKYGLLGLSSEELDFFSPVTDKRFTLKIVGNKLYERKIDNKYRRIWVSHGGLSKLDAGDVLVFTRDEKGNYSVDKKES